MKIVHNILHLETQEGISIHNVTPAIAQLIAETGIQNGQVFVFSRHTTTAIAINEDEARLLEDVKVFLQKLAPPSDRYLHNDLHLRDVPEKVMAETSNICPMPNAPCPMPHAQCPMPHALKINDTPVA